MVGGWIPANHCGNAGRNGSGPCRHLKTDMNPHFIHCTLGAVIACALGTAPGEALTIYRVGGEGYPVPEAADKEGIDFVQLSWADVDEDLSGSFRHLEINESMTPVRLDPGVNMAPRIRELGGCVFFHHPYDGWEEDGWDIGSLMDGDYGTAFIGYFDLSTFSSGDRFSRAIWIDLAGLFPIRRVVFQPRPEFLKRRFVRDFFIGTNDGDIRKRGTRAYKHTGRFQFIDFDAVYNVAGNRDPIVDLELPDVPIAEMLFESPKGDWEIAEFEIYGDGFVSRASYLSNVFDLGGRSILGDLTWSGSEDPGAGIELSMRTGDDDDPNAYWRRTFRGDERTRFDREGRLLDRRSYSRLEGGEKAGIRPDRENWGFWRGPFDFEKGRSDQLDGKPRRFLQIKADFISTRGSSGSVLDFLQIGVSTPPLATEVVAEIFPREARLGETTSFTYKLLPRIQGDDLGFDSIQINTPLSPASVDGVRIGPAVLSSGEFAVTPWDGESFSVHIPRVDLDSSGELIEVVFRSEVFKVGTVFTGRVYDSRHPMEVRQRVTAGDADPLVEGNTLSVSPAMVNRRAIRSFEVSAFTPNGDGINDLLKVDYDLVNLAGGVPVALEVFNLAGRRVTNIPVKVGISGRFTATWDGRDEEARLLSPGLYLLRLEVEADEETAIEVTALPVVY